MRRDLFDDHTSGTVIDHALLNRLAAEKLATLASEIRAEGWDWVDVNVDFDSSVLTNFRRVQPVRVELSEVQQARSAALAEEYDQLADSVEADDGDESVLARIGEIEGELEALEEAQCAWTPETLAIAGAIVTLTWDGSLDVIRGLIRRGDEPEVVSSEEPPRKATSIPAALIEALTTEKSSIVSRALSTNPAVALAAVVHALALQTFYSFGREQSCLKIAVRDIPFGAGDDDMHHDWAARVPEDPSALWLWCLEQPQDTLMALLAHVAGQCVDAVQRKSDRPDNARFSHSDALARALGIDMTSAFTPNVENYFSRISSAQIISALCDAKGVPAAPAWSKMKKAELAAYAARETSGTGWLPEPMRLRDEQDTNLDEAA